MPRVMPVAQIPLIVSDFYLSSTESGLIQYADSPLNVSLRSIRFHHTFQKRRRIVDMEQRIPITMDSYIIQIRTGFAQQRHCPILVRRGSRKQFGILSHAAHQLGRLTHQRPPLLHRTRSQFMCAPVFIPHTPILHMVRLGIAVCSTHPSVFPDSEVTIFHPIAHLLWSPCSCVGTNVRFASDLPTPFYILIRPESVRVFYLPGLVVHRGTFFPHSVQPMIGRYETATRPTYNRGFDFPQSLNHILAETIFIGKLRLWVVQSSVHLIIEMLDKLSENHFAVFYFRCTGHYGHRVLCPGGYSFLSRQNILSCQQQSTKTDNSPNIIIFHILMSFSL